MEVTHSPHLTSTHIAPQDNGGYGGRAPYISGGGVWGESAPQYNKKEGAWGRLLPQILDPAY